MFKGDTILIKGDLQSEMKQVNAESFTQEIHNPNKLIENIEFCPRVLLATSSCICAGLDCS